MTKLFVYGALKPWHILFSECLQQYCVDYYNSTLSGFKLYEKGPTKYIKPGLSSDYVEGVVLEFNDESIFDITDPIEGYKGVDRLTNSYIRIKVDDIWVYVGTELLESLLG